jgi:hypothetical protein
VSVYPGTPTSAGAFSCGEELAAGPLTDGKPGPSGGGADQVEFVVGEADGDGVASWACQRRPAEGGAHALVRACSSMVRMSSRTPALSAARSMLAILRWAAERPAMSAAVRSAMQAARYSASKFRFVGMPLSYTHKAGLST